MKRSVKWLIAALLAITAASVAAVVFMAAHGLGPDADDDAEEAVKIPSHVSVRDGRVIVTLDAAMQAREGIRSSALKPAAMRAELRGTAVLLAVDDLAASRNTWVAGRAKLDRDRVDLNLARTQYDRVRKLYEQNQNLSLKAVQDAEAAWRDIETQTTADEQTAQLPIDAVRQRWGPAVAEWVANGGDALRSLLDQRRFLMQVVFPPGETGAAPPSISPQLPGNRLAQASYVSGFPQVNPQIQGIGFLYVMDARPGLAAGMNLAVLVPVGRLLHGATIPTSAVVWWQGKAWAYEQTSADTFTRREVPTDNPVNGGLFVAGTAFPPGVKLVLAGAQALLSEEFRRQIQQEE